MNNSESAVLWCVELDGNGAMRPLAQTSIRPETLTWIHIHCDNADADHFLSNIGLDENTVDALLANETRPRTVLGSSSLLVYLRGINKNPGAELEDMVSLRLYLKGNLLITARKRDRSLLSVWDVKTQLEQGEGPCSLGELICAINERIADRISEAVDAIEDTISDYESALSEGELDIDRHQLALLRRQSSAIRRYLAPQREALDVLFRAKNHLNEDQTHDIREQADRITRYVEDLDLARERTVMLQEELRNQVAEKQGMRMYVLSLVTAIFLPLSFLTGVFGMNVAGLPGTQEPNAFMYLAIGMGITAIVALALMMWRKWL